MTIAQSPQADSLKSKPRQFASFEDYLAVAPSLLPEGRYEYWNGELVPVMSESGLNDDIANYLYFLLVSAGIWSKCVKPHSCEVEVIGKPRTRFPDLAVLDEIHVPLIDQRNTITRDMPPPRLLVEVVSPGGENSDNYKRDYRDKAAQYGAIGVAEYWLIDPERAVVLVGRLENGAYVYSRFTDEQTIMSPAFPALRFTAKQVLTAGA